jgi:hypothetical protein
MRAGTEVALLLGLAAVECLGACTGYESEYEKGVYDYEPVYCYQTIGVAGTVECTNAFSHLCDRAGTAPIPGQHWANNHHPVSF